MLTRRVAARLRDDAIDIFLEGQCRLGLLLIKLDDARDRLYAGESLIEGRAADALRERVLTHALQPGAEIRALRRRARRAEEKTESEHPPTHG